MLLGISVEGEDPHEVAAQMGYYLIGLTQANRLIMRRRRIPPIYSSGVRYEVEPWAGDVQSLRNCREAFEDGWAECKSLSAWLCAQYREQAPDELTASRYDIDVTWEDFSRDPLGLGLVPFGGVVRVFHARVVHPSGKIEDPSKRLRRRR